MLRRKYFRTPGEQGFSLVELLIVIAVIGLMALISIPYFQGIIRRGRLQNAASTFGTGLLRARLQAVKRGSNIGLSVTNDSSSPEYGNLLLFVDSDANNAYNASDTILTTIPMPPDAGSRFLHVWIDDPNQASPSQTATTFAFVFTPFGSATNANVSGAVAKAIYVADDRGNVLQVAVPMATSGKIATTKYFPGPTPAAGYYAPPWQWN